jgi:hypothetical protein
MYALLSLVIWLLQPVSQLPTLEIPLKHLKAADMDVWIATSWQFSGNLSWTVNYERNALTVSGTAKEIADFKSSIEYQDRTPSLMEFTIRRIRLPKEMKEKLDLSMMRGRLITGNAGLIEHLWQFTSVGPSDIFDQINKLPSLESRAVTLIDSTHFRYASTIESNPLLFTLCCRVNGDNSVSTWFILDSMRDAAPGSMLTRYGGSRRMRKGSMLVIVSDPAGLDLAITINNANKKDVLR